MSPGKNDADDGTTKYLKTNMDLQVFTEGNKGYKNFPQIYCKLCKALVLLQLHSPIPVSCFTFNKKDYLIHNFAQ